MSVYERKTPLLPEEVRFEDFYIRYGVDESKAFLTAEVWLPAEWRDDKPVFFNGCHPVITEPTKAEPLITLVAKWDGCCDLHLPYIHLCGDLGKLDAVVRCVTHIYDDLCEKHEVGEY